MDADFGRFRSGDAQISLPRQPLLRNIDDALDLSAGIRLTVKSEA